MQTEFAFAQTFGDTAITSRVKIMQSDGAQLKQAMG